MSNIKANKALKEDPLIPCENRLAYSKRFLHIKNGQQKASGYN